MLGGEWGMMRIWARLLAPGLLVACAALLPSRLLAEDVRPLWTEDLAILCVNSVQLQVGENYIDDFRSIRTGERGSLWEDGHLAIRWSVGLNVELWAEGTPYKRFAVDSTGRHNEGVGDFTLWGKYRVWQSHDSSGAFGFRFGIKLPNTPARKDFGTNQSDVYALLMASKSWGRFKLWGNLGLGILDNPYKRQSNDDVYVFGLAASCKLSQAWLVAGELVAFRSNGEPVLFGNSSQGRLALVHNPGSRWSFDISGARATGTGKMFGSWSVTAGLSYRFGS